MTTVTDLIPDVISYLVTQCQSNVSLGAATPPVGVFDGPAVSRDLVLSYPQRLWIGLDALTNAPEPGSATQKFSFVGASGAWRDETGEIFCTAEDYSGDTVIANRRAGCKAIIGAVEIMLRGAPSTGGPGDSSMAGLVQWSQTEGPFNWSESEDGNGASAMCVFRVTYFARLTP